MRFMMMVKGTKQSETGGRPSGDVVKAKTAFNEELVQAGVLLAAEDLHPSSSGVRVSFAGPHGKPNVTVGPFAETKELVAGFTLIDVPSKEEAFEWALRMLEAHAYGEGEIELRQIYEATEPVKSAQDLAMEADLYGQVQALKRK